MKKLLLLILCTFNLAFGESFTSEQFDRVREAANQGSASSQLSLAQMYGTGGEGVAKDPSMSFKLTKLPIKAILTLRWL